MHRRLQKHKHLIYCAICLYTKAGVANEAVTILGGTATCYDHIGYAQDKIITQAIIDLRKKE